MCSEQTIKLTIKSQSYFERELVKDQTITCDIPLSELSTLLFRLIKESKCLEILMKAV